MFLQLDKMILELAVLAALIAVVVGLALYRFFASKDQDFHIHINANEAVTVGKQNAVADKLNWIDRWGKSLTVLTLIYFFALLALILYRQWQIANTTIMTN